MTALEGHDPENVGVWEDMTAVALSGSLVRGGPALLGAARPALYGPSLPHLSPLAGLTHSATPPQLPTMPAASLPHISRPYRSNISKDIGRITKILVCTFV